MTASLRSAPVAPGKLPLVGHVVSLWRDPLRFLRSLPPLGGVVRVNLGSWPVYFLTTPKLVHEILVTQGRHLDRGRSFDKLRPLFGNGLMTAAGDFQRQQRHLIQPLFHRAQVASYVDTMRKHATATADSWQPGQIIAVDQAMYQLTVTTVAEILFSAELAPQAISEVQRSLPAIAQGTVQRALSPRAFDRLPLPFNRRYDEAAERLHRVLDQLIGANHAEAAERQDMLSLLLSTGMSDQQVHDELVTLLVLGTETTATTLSWAFYELARHPEVERHLRVELATVLSDRAITARDIPGLSYTDQFLNEIARRYAMLVSMRRATTPLTLGGYHIPTGTELAYSPNMLHHDPGRYRDPDVLDPRRWLPDRAKHPAGEDFIPFGDGSRKCLGQHFAWTMLVVALATILTRWQLCPALDRDVREVPAAVPKPDKLPMIAIPAARQLTERHHPAGRVP
jgi:cytochrome P450